MSLLTKPEQLVGNKTYKGLIYGQPGIGKTTLALSAPNPVCIDLDRGMHRVAPQYRVPSLQVDSYKQVLELVKSEEIDVFDTIVIDTLGKLVDRMAEHLASQNPKMCRTNGQPTQQGWGEIKSMFKELSSLLERKKKSIIFVAHESEEKNGDIAIKRPDCAGSTRKDIVKELDFMGYMEMIDGKRTISFTPSDKFYAKNSLELNEYLNINNIDKTNNFISKNIIKLTEERCKEQSVLHEKYNKLVESIDSDIAKIESLEDINNFYQGIEQMQHIWNSPYYAKQQLAEKIDSLGVIFDKETKTFVKIEKEKND